MKPIVVSFASSLHNKSKREAFTLTCTARGYRQPQMMKLEKENSDNISLIKEWDISACTKTDEQTVKCTYTFAKLGELNLKSPKLNEFALFLKSSNNILYS